MRSVIQSTPAFELSIDVTSSAHGHHLRLVSFVPIARRPEHQFKSLGVLSTSELKSLRDALDEALTTAADRLSQ